MSRLAILPDIRSYTLCDIDFSRKETGTKGILMIKKVKAAIGGKEMEEDVKGRGRRRGIEKKRKE